MRIHLFENTSVSSKKLNEKIVAVLSGKQVYFTVKWTEDAPLLLYAVNYKVNGRGWIDALNGEAIKDTDGDITILIGSFYRGDEIEIAFGMKAFYDIPRCIILISQTNPDELLIKKPETGYKRIDDYDSWEDSISTEVL